MFPYVNAATIRVLALAGYEAVIPKAHQCCGSLMVHGGELERGRVFVRETIDEFERAGVDFVAVNAAGCGSVMKEYGEVRDISQLLADAPLGGRLRPLPLTVTYHDACHLAHGQRVRQEPRKLLRAIPELRLVELQESDFLVAAGRSGRAVPVGVRPMRPAKAEPTAEPAGAAA
ncbi:MAG: hypothetical protein HY294_11155 [Candidatus Rokubacteria bacterium]|nr:hypothetical protein [Candidatus Rokubacteria bacterium]